MPEHERRSEWTVLAGIGLVILGAWLLAERFLSPLIAPLRVVIETIGRIGWPLALIGLGALLIYAARRRQDAAGADRRLFRSRSDRMISGVLGGVAAYLGWEPTVVRVLFVAFAVITGFWPALLLYIVALVVIPEEPFRAGVQAPPPPPPPSPPPAGSGPGV